MKQKKSQFLVCATLALTAFSLTSCGLVPRSSGPMSLGPDTWRIAARSAGGNSTESQRMALDEAKSFCQSMARELLVIGTQRDQYGPYEVTFRCLRSNDPGLQRPNLEPVPDAVIRIK